MTVKQLISRLRKLPADAQVAVCMHDNDPSNGGIDGTPTDAVIAPPALVERGYEVVILC